ncbi:hypothetical protein [Streptomyces sp. NPDC088923]|uniref:hypothetical protein n=1 Tax=Streptomyces sp. NPDC088923 TaxID=3365913 RepID=UPI00381E793C
MTTPSARPPRAPARTPHDHARRANLADAAAGTSGLPDAPLPHPGTLTPEQQRGAACVWCATPLRPGVTDIDLGPRRWRPSDGAEVAWFPRTCPDCYYLQGGR